MIYLKHPSPCSHLLSLLEMFLNSERKSPSAAAPDPAPPKDDDAEDTSIVKKCDLPSAMIDEGEAGGGQAKVG